MNILVDRLPTSLVIDGHEHVIRYDFRSCLKIILAFEDPELAAAEKHAVLLNNLYVDLPKNAAEALDQGVWFLNGGNMGEEFGAGAGDRLYSFEHDSSFILAAFQQTHHIDLQASEMHWWKFIALFMDVGSETTFSSIVGLRHRLRTGKASKEERQIASQIGDIVNLPTTRSKTLEELEADDRFNKLMSERREKKVPAGSR